MPQRPPMKALSAFEAVVRHGSFAGAAEELHVTPSAVSHQIKALEGFLGQRLFDRLKRGVQPTAACRSYYDHVAQAFRWIEGATESLQTGVTGHVLKVNSAPSFATQWLMPRMAAFMNEHPDITLNVTATPEPADFAAEGVDIDIRYGEPTTNETVVVWPLCEEYVVPMCAPALTHGPEALTKPADLARFTLIHSPRCLLQWHDWLGTQPELALEPGAGPRFDRSYMSLSAATHEVGVALESTLLAHPELSRGDLVLPFGRQAGLPLIGHYLIMPRGKAGTAKVKAFTDWLFGLLDNEAGNFKPLPHKRPNRQDA